MNFTSPPIAPPSAPQVQRIQDDFCIKIVSVNKDGTGIAKDSDVSSIAKSNSAKQIHPCQV